MAIFRAIFCGVFLCASISLSAWGARSCAVNYSVIRNYNSECDITSFLKVKYVNAAYGTKTTPIEEAIDAGNVKAVEALLNADKTLANSHRYEGDQKNTSMLEFNTKYCLNDVGKRLAISEMLISSGANIDALAETDCSPSIGLRGKCTLLDQATMYGDYCEANPKLTYLDCSDCKKIAKALKAAGAKTYAELSGQTKNNSATATSATRTSVPQTQSPETAKTVNTEQTVKTNAAEPVNAQASVASIDNDGSNKTDAGTTAVGDAVAVSTTITPQSEKGNTTEKDSEVKVEQVPEKEEISSDAEESSAGSGAGNKGEAPIAAAAVQGRVASVHNGVIQQNIDAMKVTECRPCAGDYSVICRDKKVGDECVYETKCRNPDWKLFNDGQYDAYCEEPPQLGASMVRPRNVSCSEEELNSINAVMGTKNSKGICEPIVCKIDYEIKDKTCVKQECTESQLKDLNAASGVIENEVCIPKDCLTNFKLVGGKCVDAAELEKQMQDAESAYDDALTRETSMGNRSVSTGAMAATGLGGMELARGLAEQAADKNAAADMAAYMATFQCKIGDNGNKINGGDTDIATPGANQLIDLYQSYVDLAASLKTRKADLGLRPGIEADVVLDKSVVGLYDDKGNGVQNGTYASLYRAAMGNQTDIDKLNAQSDATTRRVGIGGTVAGVGAVGGATGNILINKDSVDSDSNVLQQAAGLFLGK